MKVSSSLTYISHDFFLLLVSETHNSAYFVVCTLYKKRHEKNRLLLKTNAKQHIDRKDKIQWKEG